MKNNVIHGDFSMGEIDQVSKYLGQLEQGIANLVKSHEDTNKMLTVINDKMTTQIKDVTVVDIKADASHKRLDRIEPLVNNHAQLFKFMGWIVACVASIISLLANFIPSILGKFFP